MVASRLGGYFPFPCPLALLCRLFPTCKLPPLFSMARWSSEGLIKTSGGLCWLASHLSSLQALLACKAALTCASPSCWITSLARATDSPASTPCSPSNAASWSTTVSPRAANWGRRHISGRPDANSCLSCLAMLSSSTSDDGKFSPQSKCLANDKTRAPQWPDKTKETSLLHHCPSTPRKLPRVVAKLSNTSTWAGTTPQVKSLTTAESMRHTRRYQWRSTMMAVRTVATGPRLAHNFAHVWSSGDKANPVRSNGSQTRTCWSWSVCCAIPWRPTSSSSSSPRQGLASSKWFHARSWSSETPSLSPVGPWKWPHRHSNPYPAAHDTPPRHR